MAESEESQPGRELLIKEGLEFVEANPVRTVGDPETITAHYGTVHNVQFWVANHAGRTYVVAEEKKAAREKAADKKAVSPDMTQGVYFVEVKDLEDPKAVDAAVAEVRRKISEHGFEEPDPPSA